MLIENIVENDRAKALQAVLGKLVAGNGLAIYNSYHRWNLVHRRCFGSRSIGAGSRSRLFGGSGFGLGLFTCGLLGLCLGGTGHQSHGDAEQDGQTLGPGRGATESSVDLIAFGLILTH